MSLTMKTSIVRAPAGVAFRPANARFSSRAAVRRPFVVRADKDPEQAAKDAGKNIKEGLAGALNEGEKKLKNLSDQAGDIADDASSTGKKQANKAEGAAKDTANKAEKEGKGLGDALKDGIKNAADAVSGKAKDVKKNV